MKTFQNGKNVIVLMGKTDQMTRVVKLGYKYHEKIYKPIYILS